MGVCVLCFVLRYFMSILVDGEERVGCFALSLSSWCLVIGVWLFLAVPWVCLQFVIVVFPDHTHYFWYVAFFTSCENLQQKIKEWT